MGNVYRLNIGDKFDNGHSNIQIVDEDRLCYLVKSTSKNALGVRTISKSLFKEWVDYFEKHPTASAHEAREYLSGKSNIDKYEYGYESTLRFMALMAIDNSLVTNPSLPLQTIYYGTPGSGKSHKVKELVKNIEEDYIFRTTFHPDSDYASFVGCYKPVMKNNTKRNSNGLTIEELAQKLSDYYNVPRGGQIDGLRRFCYEFSDCIKKVDLKKLVEMAEVSANFDGEIKKYLSYGDLFAQLENTTISYEFTPQAFTKAYVKAWQNPGEPVYLIIEEINRGNCAQIFGDLFQLLDRKDGVSEYPIDADNDLKDYLEREDVLGVGHDGIDNGKLRLPSNLNILATMNTSDQSLFPMDSAFKRRWDWECVPVDYENVDSAKFVINIDGKDYLWHDFLKNVNARIKKATDSEDKQMGNFFITGNVTENQFVNKVMFYLWNDICKEEFGSLNNLFRNYIDEKKSETEEFSFNDLFTSDKKKLLSKFMEYIEVKSVADVKPEKSEEESE